MNFNENEHPRDKDGKFTDGAGEGSAAKIRRVEKKHFPHLTEGGESGTIKLPDMYVGRSLGAKARDFVVFDSSKEYMVVEGTHIQNVVAFAGAGCKKKLHFLTHERLLDSYGGKRASWRHCKGIALLDDNGIHRKAEIHWFEEPSIGVPEAWIKEWLE